MKYFIYCRKSQEAEDRQVLSLESQVSEARKKLAALHNAEVVEVLVESQTARKPGRPIFNSMLDRIAKGEAGGIIAWHPDRLARNATDSARVISFLDSGVLRELQFANHAFENTPQGLFMLQIMFGYSKYYVDNLSENVKRGNRTKIGNGWLPNKPPIGYINDRLTSTIVKDPDRFEVVQKLWQLVIRGQKSPRQIWRLAALEWGLRTRRSRMLGDKPLALGAVYRMLKNPFYAGLIRWNGAIVPGKHPAMITEDEFNLVQRNLERETNRRPMKKEFAFTGWIRCGECGFSITAHERQNKYGSRYTYYHCSKQRRDLTCGQPHVRKEALEKQIVAFLMRVFAPARIEAMAHKQQTRSIDLRNRADELQQEKIGAALAKLEGERAELTRMRFRQLIDDDQFSARSSELNEACEVMRSKQRILQDSEHRIELFEKVMEFSVMAVEMFRSGEIDIQRRIMRIVGLNPILRDKILSIEAAKPFREDGDSQGILERRAVVKDVRTFSHHHDIDLGYEPTLKTTCEQIEIILSDAVTSPIVAPSHRTEKMNNG